MWMQALAIVLTALLSSLLTLGLAAHLFEHRYRKKLEAEIDARLAAAIAELGAVIEERVRRGVLDAVAAIPSSEVIESTTRAAARTGMGLMEEGLNVLLGAARPPRTGR